MFDIGALELLMIVIVAVIVIGPKDMPLAMRTAGRWIGKVRRVSAHFRTGIDAMVREAELEDMEKKWKARNEEIMQSHPSPAPGVESGDANQGDLSERTGGVNEMIGPPAFPDDDTAGEKRSQDADPASQDAAKKAG